MLIVVVIYEKRGNSENYIKEAKYDLAVGNLLLEIFWANEAVFQLILLAYNLFCCSSLIPSIFQNTGENQDIPFELDVSCCEDHQKCKICGYEAPGKRSV